jgi:hypothetical protein
MLRCTMLVGLFHRSFCLSLGDSSRCYCGRLANISAEYFFEVDFL